ncbi:hypothetical protein PG984_012187 [Apiospora sp. TS-2023a]
MRQAKPTYHLPPNFSTPPPPHGPFHLGTILCDLDKHEQMRPLHPADGRAVTIPADQIYTDIKAGFEASRSRLTSGGMGLWARFLGLEAFAGVGARAELICDAEREAADRFTAERLETTFFYPSPEQPLFLVTGLKVARGLTLSSERGKKLTATAELSVQTPDESAAEEVFYVDFPQYEWTTVHDSSLGDENWLTPYTGSIGDKDSLLGKIRAKMAVLRHRSPRGSIKVK